MKNRSPPGSDSTERSDREGVRYGLAAYLIWGFFPVYFKALSHVPPLEVLAHRIFWSAAFLLVLVKAAGKGRDLARAFADRRILATLGCSTSLIAVNWLVFIYAVGAGHILESSLGYFINPLVSVLLGFLFLRERLSVRQNLSLALAGVGVLSMAVSYGQIPWISLVLAVSFGTYGLLRKTAPIESLLGLTVETCLLGPLALALIIGKGVSGQGHFLAGSALHSLLLPLSGLVTALPLLLFTAAARRLRLATVGFLQYITPSLHLLLAVWAYGEPFTRIHLLTFSCIWLGLAIYSLDAARATRVPRVLGNPQG